MTCDSYDVLTIPAPSTSGTSDPAGLLRLRLQFMADRRRRLGIGRMVAGYATIGWRLEFIETHVRIETSIRRGF